MRIFVISSFNALLFYSLFDVLALLSFHSLFFVSLLFPCEFLFARAFSLIIPVNLVASFHDAVIICSEWIQLVPSEVFNVLCLISLITREDNKLSL